MHAHQDIAVGVHLEQVAIQLVVPQTTHGERGVVDELLDFGGVAEQDELLDYEVEAEDLVFGRLVQRQRVVHVEAEELDLGELQGAVDEDAVRGVALVLVCGEVGLAGLPEGGLGRLGRQLVGGRGLGHCCGGFRVFLEGGMKQKRLDQRGDWGKNALNC